MVLARVEEPFDHPEWIFEAKLDGFRALAYIQGGRCEVVSRKNHVYKSFSRLKYGTYTEDEHRTSWVKIKNRAYSQAIGRHEQFTQFAAWY